MAQPQPPPNRQPPHQVIPVTHRHNIQQLHRLSYLLDKVQENTLAYQAEATFNNARYLHLFKAVVIVSVIKDIAGLIISDDSIGTSEVQKYTLLATSIIGIIIAAINAISGAYEYQAKKQQFSAAVEQFDLLEDRIRFEMINPDEDFNHFCQQLEADIESIKSQCKYQPSLENKARYRKRSNRPGNTTTMPITTNINTTPTSTANTHITNSLSSVRQRRSTQTANLLNASIAAAMQDSPQGQPLLTTADNSSHYVTFDEPDIQATTPLHTPIPISDTETIGRSRLLGQSSEVSHHNYGTITAPSHQHIVDTIIDYDTTDNSSVDENEPLTISPVAFMTLPGEEWPQTDV